MNNTYIRTRYLLIPSSSKVYLQVTALNDPAINVDYITYLIKFDSTHGKFKGSVTNNKKEVIVNGRYEFLFPYYPYLSILFVVKSPVKQLSSRHHHHNQDLR